MFFMLFTPLIGNYLLQNSFKFLLSLEKYKLNQIGKKQDQLQLHLVFIIQMGSSIMSAIDGCTCTK